MSSTRRDRRLPQVDNRIRRDLYINQHGQDLPEIRDWTGESQGAPLTSDTASSPPAAPDDPEHDLKTLPLPEVEKHLATSEDGLSQAEATKRLSQYGANEIAEHKTNPLLKFLSYFWGPIPWMIEVAVILSGAVGHWPDFFIILVLLVANALVGYSEERQAGNAIEALKAKLAITARVKRDGTWVTPAARDLVPGDVIRLRLGDIVPADARLMEGDEIEVDQSALTGAHTYFGKTADLVQEAHTVSHFQKAVLKIGNYLIVLAAVFVALIIGVSLLRGDPILTTLQFALVLTVAAIPVAMAHSAVGDDGRGGSAIGQEAGHRE